MCLSLFLPTSVSFSLIIQDLIFSSPCLPFHSDSPASAFRIPGLQEGVSCHKQILLWLKEGHGECSNELHIQPLAPLHLFLVILFLYGSSAGTNTHCRFYNELFKVSHGIPLSWVILTSVYNVQIKRNDSRAWWHALMVPALDTQKQYREGGNPAWV